MARPVATTPLAVFLREEIDRRKNENGGNYGIRTLARKINPSAPEVARRALNRYIFEGARPTLVYRVAIAAALDVPVDEVPGSADDDEEDEAAMREAFRLFADLMGRLNARDRDRVTA